MTTTTTPPLERARDGRVLGGVCAGLARRYDLSLAWLRAGFAVAALAGGVGVLVYLAAWLIVPGEDEPGRSSVARGTVVLAQACAAAVGLATLSAVAGASTLFGFGWVVVVVGVVILGGVLAAWGRVGPSWALLPLAALLVPSLALATARIHLEPQIGAQRFDPAALAGSAGARYASGLGPLFVDLRRTRLPAGGAVSMRIDAGAQRTVVALPHDRCVHVDVTYDVRSLGAPVTAALGGIAWTPRVNVFQLSADTGTGELLAVSARPGPTLHLHFASVGGSLFVRDYPDSVDPEAWFLWPGHAVAVEPRPDVSGMSKRSARRALASWRLGREAARRTNRRMKVLLPGPCGRAR